MIHGQQDQQPDTYGATAFAWPVALFISLFTVGLVVGGTLSLFDTPESQTEVAWIRTQNGWTPGARFDDSTSITLSRGPCYGTCPSYRVTVFGSGRVEYEGGSFVCRKGRFSSMADPKMVSALIEGLLAIDFGSMSDATGYDLTDSSSARVTFVHGGKSHSMEHYHGDLQAPKVLRRIEDRIDRVAFSAQWAGFEQYHGRYCPQADGTFREITWDEEPPLPDPP